MAVPSAVEAVAEDRLVAEAAEVAAATAALAVADKGALQYDWHEWYKHINNQSGATTTNKVQ